MRLGKRWLVRAMMFGLVTSALTMSAAAQSWIQLNPPNSPAPYGGPGQYDPASNRMILFGANGGGGYSNEVWVLTNVNGLGGAPEWLKLAPIQDPVNGFPAPRQPWTAYDPVNNRLIIMDGCLGNCLPVATDQWVLTNANGLGGTPAWFKLSPTGGPPGQRVGHVMAYDPGTNSLIIFGGQNGCCATPFDYSDVWVLSNANGLGGTPVWTQLNPTGGPPPGQETPSGVYDPKNNRLVVFGGWPNLTTTPTNAVWVLTNANGQGGTPVWMNLVPEGAPGSPPPRRGHNAVYDPSLNSMIIFAGTGASGDLNDVWVLSNANGLGGTPVWTPLMPTGGPPGPRDFAAAVLDPGSHRMTIFAGGGPANYADTWVLTLVAPDAFQTRYFSNLTVADSYVNLTNTGASATTVLANQSPAQNNIDGNICVNLYAFAADEQEVACCSCLVTPNGLWSASVKTALLNSTLTPSFPNEVVVKMISTLPNVGTNGMQTCNPAAINQTNLIGTAPGVLASGLLGWGTSAHGFPTTTGPNFSITETPFLVSSISIPELQRDVQECQFIQILGSGQFGICKGCSNVGLGAAAQ